MILSPLKSASGGIAGTASRARGSVIADHANSPNQREYMIYLSAT
jgi:hypothetical protein